MSCPSAAELQSLVDAPVDAADRERITTHAESCEACRAALVALFRGMAPTAVSQPSEPPPTGELAPGTRLDRYVIERRLGAGAMGVVYAARDPELDRLVAVKLLHARQRGEALQLRLSREARALARVSHPNVVTVHDVGTHAGDVFVAMELVRGETLRAWLARGQSRAAILDALVAAGRGLAAAHEVGLVHRDFKPDNVLVGDDGRVRVTDFGLARAASDTEQSATTEPPADALLATLTQTGSMVGTPLYAAPEQLAGQRVSSRSDQFSFCVTAYEALCGQRPFDGATYGELVSNIAKGAIRDAPIDDRIDRVVRRGLAADSEARFASMTELVDALVPPVEPPRRRWPWLVAGGATIAAGVAIAIVATRAKGGLVERCDASARMARLWPTPSAAALPPELRSELDQYATAWIAERDRACEAAKSSTAAAVEQAPRATCLDAALLHFGTVIAQARTHPPRTPMLVDRAFGHLDTCVRARGEIPEEPAPAIADRVSNVRLLVEEARAAHVLDDLARADDRLAAAISAASGLAYLPVEAELAATQGTLAASRGDSPLAIEHFRRALKLAEASRHDRVKAEAAASLARALVQIGRFEEAIGILDLGEATVARSGGNLAIEAALVMQRARIADVRGQTPEAIRLLEDAIARARPQRRSALIVAMLQVELQNIFVRIGRNSDAAKLAAAANAVLRMYEPEASATSRDLADRCEAAQLAADFERANDVCARHVAALELAQPVDDTALSEALKSLSITHELQMHWLGAHEHAARAATLAERTGRLAESAFLLESAGRDSIELGEIDRAIGELQRSVDLATKAADGSDQLLFSRVALGRAYVAAKRHVPAIEELEWAMPRLEARTPPSLNALAGTRFALAEALWQRSGPGDRERAKQLATLAREAATRFRDSFPADTGLDAIYRRRMDLLVAKIDAWSARR